MGFGTPYTHTRGYGTVATASDAARAEFIGQVYRIFLASLGVTVLAAWIAAQPPALEILLPAIGIVALLGLVVGVAMAFASRVQGLNLVLLLLYSAFQGAVIGPILVMVERTTPGVAGNAAILTLAIFGGLSGYTLVTRKDFSYLGGFLFAALLGLLVAGIALLFLNAPMLSVLYSYGGALIFCLYILYDTSRIIHRLEPGEAVAGAIALYLDLVNLFWFILRILRSNSR